MSATNHIKTVVNKVFLALKEPGLNKAKTDDIAAAMTALATAKAVEDEGALTASQVASVNALIAQLQFAQDMGSNTMNGSIGLALNEKRGAQYKHVEAAEVLAAALLSSASATTSTIVVSDATLATGGATCTITVQLKDAIGRNLTVSGGEVELATTGASTIGAVTDVGDGTYTATFTTGVTAQTAVITGTVDGAAIVDDASVVIS
jgi:uracil phosphoribosyltransferase